MFAILITRENLATIIQREPKFGSESFIDIFLASRVRWYAVTGYYNGRKLFDWTILPAYILENEFEYDADKIQTEWDQIVRKNK